MRDIIRLSLTLALVGILSASLLTVVHGITAPIIAERQEEEYRLALESYFPGFASFETKEIEGDKFDLIYDEDGALKGIMSTSVAMGYEGDIVYNLAVDAEGNIVGLRVVAHSETPGIGDVITTEPFKEQFYGKSFDDPIAGNEDIDIVSGATVSCVAITNSIRRLIGVIGEEFMGLETIEVDITQVPDGVYEGSAPGLMGPIVVSVEVSGGEIVDIEVLEHEETPTYFIEAYPLIPELIIENQHFDVDTKTGATISAEGIVNAVQDALAGAME